jgi:alkanesulfonate monooxygenase SsuD/methylene tetrahydromethanopterin reductase-like flavin-dependent oxidoreductase (luciferase family)
VSALDRVSVAAIGTSVADLEAETLRAEAAGVECVWAPELFRSAVTQATYLAAKTERIGVATGIVWAFTRSPFIHAVSALDVDEMSGGRFRLGMGAGVKRLNETWHNADYGRPAPHLREAIEATRLIMRQASAGEPIRYEGEYYDIDIKGWIRPHPAPREAVPIYTAAVQAGMARMAGDVADGLIGHPIQSLRWIDEVVVPAFEEGLRRSDRERSDFDYLPTVCCAIDEDEGRAIEMARRTISFYATVRVVSKTTSQNIPGLLWRKAGEPLRSLPGLLVPMPRKKGRKTGGPPQTAAASLPWASPRSLHLTPVGHIVSGWGQMQGAPSFGPGKRGGCTRCNRSFVRSPLAFNCNSKRVRAPIGCADARGRQAPSCRRSCEGGSAGVLAADLRSSRRSPQGLQGS